MNKTAQYAVPITIIVLAILIVLVIVMVYPSERAEILKPGSSEGFSVAITGSGFSPSETSIPSGARVTWVNTDSSAHTIKFLDSESQIIKQGGRYSRTFSEKGVFTYTSSYNPGFRGTVTVT